MLVYCDAKCKSLQDASLDVDEDLVYCNTCGEVYN